MRTATATAAPLAPLAPLALLALATLAAAGCSKRQPAPDRPAGLPATAPAAGEQAAAAPAPPRATPPPPAAADETVPAAPDPSATISGTITLPKNHRKAVAKTDIVFIVARRAGGPPGPGSMLAAQKHPVGDFPMPFTISGRDAMVPGTPFTGPVNLTVRLDKDGDALTRKKGDLSGQASGVAVGAQNVVISLDTVQAEDQTLGGPAGAMRGGTPPPGLPPGHP
jgi:hypothetical protein